MGKKDTLTKKYLSRPDIFADAFNYFLFDGKKVIKPKDLEEQDPTEIAVMKKMSRVFADQKMRDVLKLCTIRRSSYATLVLLGIEGQDQISYIMPVRDNLYDALNYSAQVQEIKRKHNEAKDLKTSAELMSGFAKNDKLRPVITLCVCFDRSKWDAPKSLHDMFGKIDPRLKPYINDYRLNLITPDEIVDFTKFSSGLGQAMEFIQNSDDKNRLRAIIESKDIYKRVDEDTVDIINTYTSSKISKKDMEGGKINVCTAIQGIYEDGKTEGRAEGRAEGRTEGRAEGRTEGITIGESMLINLLKLLKPGTREYDKAINGTTSDRKKLYKKYNITEVQ